MKGRVGEDGRFRRRVKSTSPVGREEGWERAFGSVSRRDIIQGTCNLSGSREAEKERWVGRASKQAICLWFLPSTQHPVCPSFLTLRTVALEFSSGRRT